MYCGIFNLTESLNDIEGRFQTLKGIKLRCDSMGDVITYNGNNVVVALLESDNDTPSTCIRCYVRQKPYLREIYGENYYPNEFRVTEYKEEVYIDVVIAPWIEGECLAKRVATLTEIGGSKGREELTKLSKSFDRLAEEIVNADWAHGDINCENIIVTPEGDLHLIDLDCKYMPNLEGKESCELGRRAYQSPLRKLHHFHSRIDDFSLAITSISLAALSIDPDLNWRHPFLDSLLLDAAHLRDPNYKTLNVVIRLFEKHGYAAHAYLAYSLKSLPVIIEDLPQILEYINHGMKEAQGRISTYNSGQLWGYYCVESGNPITPPLFSIACEFESDGATVYIGSTQHMIDNKGKTIKSHEILH